MSTILWNIQETQIANPTPVKTWKLKKKLKKKNWKNKLLKVTNSNTYISVNSVLEFEGAEVIYCRFSPKVSFWWLYFVDMILAEFGKNFFCKSTNWKITLILWFQLIKISKAGKLLFQRSDFCYFQKSMTNQIRPNETKNNVTTWSYG